MYHSILDGTPAAGGALFIMPQGNVVVVPKGFKSQKTTDKLVSKQHGSFSEMCSIVKKQSNVFQ